MADASLIRSLLAGERVIAVHSALVRLGGSVNAGLFLSQLLWWTGKGTDGDWVYKTAAEWQEETLLGRYELENARRTWRDLGVLEEEQRQGRDRVLSYRIDFEALAALVQQQGSADASAGNQQMQALETSSSKRWKPADAQYTEKTTERTAESLSAPADSSTAPATTPTSLPKPTRSTPTGKSLAPLVDAFRARGLPDPTFLPAEAKAASTLMAHYGPEDISGCWQDVRNGDWGDDWLRDNLSFSTLAKSNRIGNWRDWNDRGRAPRKEFSRGSTRRRDGAVSRPARPWERPITDDTIPF